MERGSSKDLHRQNISEDKKHSNSSPYKVHSYKNTEEIDASEQDPCGLSYFQASMFATVLEDTITQLRILGECNNEWRVIKTMVDLPLLRALKYNVKQPATVDQLEGIDRKKLDLMEYKLKKLFTDRNYVNEVLQSTYLGLALHRSYGPLAEHVKKIVDHNNYCTFMQDEEAKNRVLRRELNRQYRQLRNHVKSAMYDAEVRITELKNSVEDAALNAEMSSRYVANWQIARTEQNTQMIKDKEKVPSQNIEHYKERTDDEQRVHTEIELLITIAINETLQKVEDWMNKYDKDMEAIDLKIQVMKNNQTNMYEKRVGLENMIEMHAKQIKDWIDFKDAREKARLYREKMTNAAITVQAWWRGLLVRNQLGPYKPPPKKKGNKKK